MVESYITLVEFNLEYFNIGYWITPLVILLVQWLTYKTTRSIRNKEYIHSFNINWIMVKSIFKWTIVMVPVYLITIGIVGLVKLFLPYILAIVIGFIILITLIIKYSKVTEDEDKSGVPYGV